MTLYLSSSMKTKHKIKQCALWSKLTEIVHKLHANYVEMHLFAEQSVGREQKDMCSIHYRLHTYAEDRKNNLEKSIKLIAQGTIFHIEYF